MDALRLKKCFWTLLCLQLVVCCVLFTVTTVSGDESSISWRKLLKLRALLRSEIDDNVVPEPDGGNRASKNNHHNEPNRFNDNNHNNRNHDTHHCEDNAHKTKHVMLVIQWAPGICSSGKIGTCNGDAKLSEFTIHGLWPSDAQNESLQNCCTRERYDGRMLGPLNHKLKLWWPSLNRVPAETFWHHEWQKHGTCVDKVDPINTVYKYFSFALEKFTSLKPLEALAAAGIKPSNDDYAWGADLIKAMSAKHGAKVATRCASSPGSNNAHVLTEVHLCYSLPSMKPANCGYTPNSCMQNLLFPKSSI